MVLAWLITALLGIVIYFLYWLTKSNREYWEKQGVTYVEFPPIIGSLKDLLLMKKSMGEIFTEVYQNFEGERFVGFHQFISPTILIRDPELVNQVLIKDFTHFEDRGPPIKGPRDLFSLAFGNLTGDTWRYVRHQLTPTFTSGKMKVMFGPMKECSEELVQYLQDKTDLDLEVRELILRYVLNVIGNIAFGLKIDTLNEKEEKSIEFLKYSSLFFKPSFGLLLKFISSISLPSLRDVFKFKLTDKGVDEFFTKLTKDIINYRQGTDAKRNDFVQLMLDIKKREKETLRGNLKGTSTPVHEIDSVESEDKEIMDQLNNAPLNSKQSLQSEIFTDEFIAAQTFIFISGGSETVAASVSFVLFELAQNQDLQKKVQEEITDLLSTQELNYESVKNLTYMEQFINETFRLHPVAAAITRMCSKDYRIPGTEVIIRKGNFINIPIAAIQKDPQYFPEPQKFDPDRFQDANAFTKGTFLPFGGGPRMCIAMRLAMLEMKVLLATLLSKYTVTLSDKTNVPLKLVKTSFLVAVDGGIWVKFHKRDIQR